LQLAHKLLTESDYEKTIWSKLIIQAKAVCKWYGDFQVINNGWMRGKSLNWWV